MALVQGGRNGLAIQLAQYLGQQLRGVAHQRINQLANEMIDDLAMAGPEAGRAIQTTMRQFMTTVSEGTRNQIVQATGGINRIGQELARQGQQWIEANNNEWNDMLVSMGIRAENGARDTNPQPREVQPNVNGDLTSENDAWGTHGEELPDLGDLMDGNARGGPPNAEEPVMESARASGSVGGNPVSKETQISPYPGLSYGLQETHTTILPWTGWLTAGGLDKNTPLQLKIRMNSPYDMLDCTLTTVGATDGARLTTKGLYMSPLDPDSRVSTSGMKHRNTRKLTELTQYFSSRRPISSSIHQCRNGYYGETSMARLLGNAIRILHSTRMRIRNHLLQSTTSGSHSDEQYSIQDNQCSKLSSRANQTRSGILQYRLCRGNAI